jgi:hypothetical protein
MPPNGWVLPIPPRSAAIAAVSAVAALAGGALAEPASAGTLPDFAPIPPSALGPAVNAQGYHVGRVEKNLYWVTDSTYQAAFLTTRDGVVLFDAPPTIGHNLQRAIDKVASANGVSSQVTHIVYSHHHADHLGASSLFGRNVTRIGQAETRRLLAQENDPTRPVPDITFDTRYTLRVGGERIELAWHGTNHTPDNSYIHFIGGHMGRLGTRDDMTVYQQYVDDIIAGVKQALVAVDPTPFFAKYGDNSWAAVQQYQKAQVDYATGPVIKKYTGVLAAADVYTASTAFVLLESIRLDLGVGSQVHA